MPRRVKTDSLEAILTIVAAGRARSRAGLARELDTARSTIGLSVDHLLELGFLAERDVHDGSRGRPRRELIAGPRSGSIALIDVRPGQTTIGLADITGTVQAVRRCAIRLADGAETSIDAATAAVAELASETHLTGGPIAQAVVSVPAPVNHRTGAMESPTILRTHGRHSIVSWQEYAAKHVERSLGAPALIENDANLFALADAAAVGPAGWPLVRFELSLGIGSGIVDGQGHLFRGAGGTAGDFGHITLHSDNPVRCWCGKLACVATRATIQAILKQLGIDPPAGFDVDVDVDVDIDIDVALAELRHRLAAGDAQATEAIWDAADAIGELASIVVDILNPATLVLGGELMHLGSDVLARVRAVVYERALSLSTRRLQITVSDTDKDGALLGAAILGARALLSPESLAHRLEEHG